MSPYANLWYAYLVSYSMGLLFLVPFFFFCCFITRYIAPDQLLLTFNMWLQQPYLAVQIKHCRNVDATVLYGL